jgi:hypothetical protein
MYGTVARIKIRPENQVTLEEIFRRQDYSRAADGFVHSMLFFEETGMGGWLVAVFRDKESYERNADSPEQDHRYQEWRALLETDPEWHDGHVRMFGDMKSLTDLGLEDGSGFARGIKEEGAA